MDLSDARKVLETELMALERDDALGADDQKTVTLDQQSAMAQATARRRAGRRHRIIAALKRLEEGEFGHCQDCGDDIAAGRIALDPTVSLCLSCANG
jgi:DnaK suppressor protein